MSLSTVVHSTSYWSKLAGIRWPFFLAILVAWGTARWLRLEYGQDDSNLWLVMNLFLTLAAWTMAGLFLFSLLTALAAWLLFRHQIKKKSVHIQAKFGDGQKAEAGWVSLAVMIQGPVLRPLLGTIQARLVFVGKKISDRIVLDANVPQPRKLRRQAIRGAGQTLLHDRGIYDVEKILISFGDMLGLVALPVSVPYTNQLFTLPRPLPEQHLRAQPQASEEQKHRIDVSRRVEGEYINYKEFETGDNIQRIVWKIYAKSGQLVVRVPEIKDPYASHVYCYVSYFDGLGEENGAFELELLNTYKDQVRSVYEALARNGYEVRLPHDQEVPKLSGLSEKHSELFQITAASWQSQNPPSKFVHPGKAAFVCLPSLTPADEVELLVKNLQPHIPLVVVKLSEAIPSPFQFKLKDLFFKPEKNPNDRLRQPWMIASLRRALRENESAIANMLQHRANSWLTTDINIES